jgi:hypothetical protein
LELFYIPKVIFLHFFIFIFSILLGQSRPNYILPGDFPNINIVEDIPLHDNYHMFFSSYSMVPLFDRNYLIILDSYGDLAFFKKMNMPTMDFKIQKNGLLSYISPSYPNWRWTAYTMDDSYTLIDSFEVSDPFDTDSHDFLLLENGNYIMLGSSYQYLDLTDYGGPEVSRVEGCIIQEFNQDKELIFQWSSFDHFELDDLLHRTLNAPQVDYVHANSIEVDHDGNFILSSRHLCEITKINRSSGEIIWRLGGKNNQFSFIEQFYNNHATPTPFCSQHDVRVLGNGNITFFDNGNDKFPKYSRAVEYEIDEINKTAELVWEYRDTVNYSAFLGNVQKLNNGNIMSVWNSQDPNIATTIKEIKPDCTIAMHIDLPIIVDSNNNKVGDYNYRAFKYDWSGIQNRPTLWYDTLNSSFNINFVQFGDSTIEKYYIYNGKNQSLLSKYDSTTNTRYTFDNLEIGIEQFYAVSSKNYDFPENQLSDLIMFKSYFLNYGDINYDTYINIFDLLYLCDMINNNYLVNLSADYNQDSIIDVHDINSIIDFLISN